MSNTKSTEIIYKEAGSSSCGRIIKIINVVLSDDSEDDLFPDNASDVSTEYQHIYNDLNKHKNNKVGRKPSELTLTERYNKLTSFTVKKKRNSKLVTRDGIQRWHSLDYEIYYKPMVRNVIFPDAHHKINKRNFERPLFYQHPLFQQMREELCKRNAYGCKTGNISTENQFFTSEIIKDSLLCHQKSRLSMAVLGLCYIPEVCAEMLWKVGSEVLQSNNCGHQFRSSFQNMIRLLCYHDYLPEVVMDYASSILMKENKIHEVYQVATAVISKEKFSADIYYNIFYGNLEYVLWKLEWKRFNSSSMNERSRKDWGNDDEDEESDEADENHLKGNAQMAFHGRRTIQYLKKVEEDIGIWDLILPKYIEVLTYYEGKERAVEALHNHMENNPNNPNSYEYYLHYVDESIKEREGLVKILECYCAIDPTNDWGKELLVLYKNSGCYYDLLALLITRLDHEACRDGFFDWHLLYKVVAMREQSEDIKEFFQENLSCFSSWAKYHFPVPLNKLNQNLTERVLQLKSKIADCINVDRFSDCVDAWLNSKILKFTEGVINNTAITLNISLKCDHELDNSFDEFTFLSSPEMISSEELDVDDDDDDDDADLDTTFSFTSSPVRKLPDVLIAPYDNFDCFETVDERNNIESNTTFGKKSELESTDCPNSSSFYVDQGNENSEISWASSDGDEEKPVNVAKERSCAKTGVTSKRKRKSTDNSTSSASDSDEEKPDNVVQNSRVRVKRRCKSMDSVKLKSGKEKLSNVAKKRRYKEQGEGKPAKKNKVCKRDEDWTPPTIKEKSPIQMKLRERAVKKEIIGVK